MENADPTNKRVRADGMLSAKEDLEKAVKARRFSDLHTHFFGMGDAGFWISQLRCFSDQDPTKEACFWSEKLRLLCKFEDLSREERQKYSYPSAVPATQLILTAPRLYEAIVAEEAVKDDQLSGEQLIQLRERLLLDAESVSLEFKDHSYFDARKQKWVSRYGVTAKAFLDYIDTKPELQSGLLKNCFEMLDGNGATPTAPVLFAEYQDKFSFQFYPRRYALKDDLVCQFPQVITNLFDHITERYIRAGVTYSELSISANDACRPGMVSLMPLRSKGVEYRYLAMFNRTDKENSAPEYPIHKKKLEEIKTALQISPELVERLVGFDYAGDEKNNPGCSFHLPEFQEFLADQLSQGLPFGFRIHAAESIPAASSSDVILNHLNILADTINPLLERFGILSPCPIRIGHGFGIGWAVEQGSAIRRVEFQKVSLMCEYLVAFEVPIEVCLTSNRYLVPNYQGQKSYWQMLRKNKYNVIFATDDDGIWPCAYDAHQSLAAEIARAIDEVQGDLDMEDLIKRTNTARFSILKDAPSNQNAQATSSQDLQWAVGGAQPGARSEREKLWLTAVKKNISKLGEAENKNLQLQTQVAQLQAEIEQLRNQQQAAAAPDSTPAWMNLADKYFGAFNLENHTTLSWKLPPEDRYRARIPLALALSERLLQVRFKLDLFCERFVQFLADMFGDSALPRDRFSSRSRDEAEVPVSELPRNCLAPPTNKLKSCENSAKWVADKLTKNEDQNTLRDWTPEAFATKFLFWLSAVDAAINQYRLCIKKLASSLPTPRLFEPQPSREQSLRALFDCFHSFRNAGVLENLFFETSSDSVGEFFRRFPENLLRAALPAECFTAGPEDAAVNHAE